MTNKPRYCGRKCPDCGDDVYEDDDGFFCMGNKCRYGGSFDEELEDE